MALEFKKVLAKPLVASEDMTAEMAGETVEIITAAVDKFLSTENYEKAAQAVKDGMDRKFGPTWHCCIGEGFGYDVTYNTRNMLLLYYGEVRPGAGKRRGAETRFGGRLGAARSGQLGRCRKPASAPLGGQTSASACLQAALAAGGARCGRLCVAGFGRKGRGAASAVLFSAALSERGACALLSTCRADAEALRRRGGRGRVARATERRPLTQIARALALPRPRSLSPAPAEAWYSRLQVLAFAREDAPDLSSVAIFAAPIVLLVPLSCESTISEKISSK